MKGMEPSARNPPLLSLELLELTAMLAMLPWLAVDDTPRSVVVTAELPSELWAVVVRLELESARNPPLLSLELLELTATLAMLPWLAVDDTPRSVVVTAELPSELWAVVARLELE